MSTTQYILGAIGDLTAWVLGGLALFWLLRLLVLLVEMSPLTPRAKGGILRFAPVVEMVVLVAYVASAMVEMLAEEPEFAWILLALVLALVLFSWSALYDLALGVAFRVARVCQVGDMVQVEDIDGRVLEVGVRALVIQTRDGDEAVVPYGRIGRRTLRRTQSVSGAYVHSFVLDRPVGDDFADLKRTVIEAAMRSHWASAVHEAKVERRAGGTVEISVFAHDADHAPIVETEVREAVATESLAKVGRMMETEPGHDTRQVLGEGSEDVGSEPEAAPEPGAPEPDAPEGVREPGTPEGVPEGDEDPSDVMDLRTVLGPKIPKLPPPPSWKK